MKRLTSEDVKQSIVLKAVAKGVGIYSPHTACDNCVGGGRWSPKRENGSGTNTYKLKLFFSSQ
jgi:putative NIF3 family GTP cyclohydrolase 1 type 2